MSLLNTSSTDEASDLRPAEFSVVAGGPLYRLWRRTHLSDDMLDLVPRRVVVAVLLAWLPLLLLSIAQGLAWTGDLALPFILDVETHLRLLLVVPLLIGAELALHRRMPASVGLFLDRGLIPDPSRARFDAAISSATRLRNSVVAESLMVALVYGVGVLVLWRTQMAPDVPSWHGVAVDGKLRPSLAGWWFVLVSLPLFQFLILRWYYRLFIWVRLLWQVSRIRLRLMPTHPDRCGGLAFLDFVRVAFAPLVLAHGALLAAMIADRIFFAGAELPEFKVALIGMVVLMVLVTLGPLLLFSVQLERVARTGAREYGTLAQRHAREFDQKWLRGGAPADELLVGNPDISSLADMGGAFDVVRQMRSVPFTGKAVLQLVAMTLLPILPLTLTMFSLKELFGQLLKLVL